MLNNLLFVVVFIFTGITYSQEPAYSIVGKNDLQGVDLYSFAQDKDKNIWLSSSKGIYKYNGVNFTLINTKDSPSSSLFGLTKDNFGDLYCFNLNGTIYKLKDNQLEVFFKLPPEMDHGGTIDINFDNQNNLIVLFNNKKIKFSKGKPLEIIDDHYHGFYMAKQNQVLFYGAHFENNSTGIVSLFDDKETIFQKLPRLAYNHLLLSHSKIWVIKDTLYGFNKKLKTFFKVVNNSIHEIKTGFEIKEHTELYYCDNNFWFCNIKNGVRKFELNSHNSTTVKAKYFSNFYISGVYKDFEGNTWLLTFGEGLIMIPNKNAINYKLTDDKISNIEKIDNNIFISTNNDEILQLKNRNTIPFFKTTNDRLNYFNFFKEKNVVITNTSVYYKKKKYNNIINYNRKGEIIGDTIFAATHAGLLSYIISKNKFKKISYERTFSLLKTIDSTIWVSSLKGLFKYKNGKITYLKYNDTPIFSKEIIQLKSSDLITVTKRGILILNPEGFVKKRLAIDREEILESINHIDYEYPYLYLSSSTSIFQYHLDTQRLKRFSYAEGLVDKVEKIKVLHDTVYAINSKGMLSFTFDNISSEIPVYDVKITNTIVNGFKSITNNSVLSSNQNNIEFNFNTSTFKHQKNLIYYYKLQGYDSTFVKAKNNQYFAKYSKIPAGKYEFKVKSKIGNHENKTAVFQFVIENVWYQKTWLKIVLISVLILSLYLIYWNRVRFLRRKKRENELNNRLVESSLISLKSQMNPHFMFNAINSVQSLILKDQKDDAYNYLTKFSRVIRQSLKMSDKTWVFLQEEIEQLLNYLELEKLRFGSNLNFSIDASFEYTSIKIPSLVIQPFVENAIKHGLLHKEGVKKVTLKFTITKNAVVCIIEDNGVGRLVSKSINNNKIVKHVSFSTQALKKRLELLQEYLLNEDLGFFYEDLYNQKGESRGTRVTVNLPFIKDDRR